MQLKSKCLLIIPFIKNLVWLKRLDKPFAAIEISVSGLVSMLFCPPCKSFQKDWVGNIWIFYSHYCRHVQILLSSTKYVLCLFLLQLNSISLHRYLLFPWLLTNFFSLKMTDNFSYKKTSWTSNFFSVKHTLFSLQYIQSLFSEFDGLV